MTRKGYIRKRAYLCMKIMEWNKAHSSEVTPEMIAKANKVRFSNKVPTFGKGQPYGSYQEAYDALYDACKMFVKEA